MIVVAEPLDISVTQGYEHPVVDMSGNKFNMLGPRSAPLIDLKTQGNMAIAFCKECYLRVAGKEYSP
jgi:hypothetical protein